MVGAQGGRPKLPPEQRRTERYNLRFTPAELQHLQLQAQTAGLDVAEYLRRRALGYVVPPAPTHRRCDPGLVTELNRLGLEIKAIGNNANQIARAVHTNRRFGVSWQAVVSRIEELSRQVSDTLEKILLDDS